MWDDDVDFMSLDKEDREETGRRLSGPLPPPVVPLADEQSIPLTTAPDEDDKPREDVDLTLDELADRVAGLLT